jgi:hypothetical protein
VSIYCPQATPGIRIVDANNNVVRGPHHIGAVLNRGMTNGLLLEKARVVYAPEWQGPYKKMTWEEAPVLNGFRIEVDLDFSLILSDSAQINTYGLGLLMAYMNDAVKQHAYAPLQYNHFYGDGCTTWRGLYPSTPFAPEPAQQKETSGYSMRISLKARELITDLLNKDWSQHQW